MREAWRTLRAIPQYLLVQPEQLGYDLAFGLALVPPVALGIYFFRRQALLLFALCLLAGICCLLAIQLARLTLGLPAWVGHKANHPLVASLLVACFLSPETPAWLGVTGVILLVILDTLAWPQLQRLMAHPALVVFGLIYVIERRLPIGFINPFDGRRLDDPLTLWYRFHLAVDPVKLYVGNIPGPIGATSAGAILLGIAYLWYTKKISLGLLAGFLVGVAGAALAFRYDLAFQLSSGPALFLVGYLAADRRRITIPERFTIVAGATAGATTVVLRAYGQGEDAAWQSLLLVGALITLVLRIRYVLSARPAPIVARPAAVRTLTVESHLDSRRRAPALPIPSTGRQPVMAATPVMSGSVRRPMASYSTGGFDRYDDPDDIVRQMRRAARGRPAANGLGSRIILGLSLLILNPVGLWLTWTSRSLSRRTRVLVTALSLAWYLALGGALFAVTHGLHGLIKV